MEALLNPKVDTSEVLSKKDGLCYSRKQWEGFIRFASSIMAFVYVLAAYNAQTCGPLYQTYLYFAVGFAAVGVAVTTFPLFCCGAPKFDFMFIFTDCLSETWAACLACCAHAKAAAPKVDGEAPACCSMTCETPAACTKCAVACKPCLDTAEPTKKCFGRLGGFAFSLPLWMIMALPPYLLIGFGGLDMGAFPVSMSETCPGITVSIMYAMLFATINAALTGIRLTHGSDGYDKINFYAELV